MKKIWALIAMTAATVLWGVAFSSQSSGMKFVGPMLFVALRSLVGAGALALTVMLFDLIRFKRISWWGSAEKNTEKRALIVGGVWCGLAITAASGAQQYGLITVSAGKSGFLTALYIIMVPMLAIFCKRKPSPMLYLAVFLALGGSYLLCGGVSNFGRGEGCLILCAFFFSLHIMIIDRYAAICDCIRLSCIQFASAAVFSTGVSVISGESWAMQPVLDSAPFWIFCGIGSSAIAFTLQIAAQKYLHPVTAALIMSLESVFAVIGGWIFLSEILTAYELLGCGAIFCGVIIAQIPEFRKKTS